MGKITVDIIAKKTGYIDARGEFMYNVFHIHNSNQIRETDDLATDCSIIDFMTKYYNMPVDDSTMKELERLLDATQRFMDTIPKFCRYEAMNLLPNFTLMNNSKQVHCITFDVMTIKELIAEMMR